MISAANPKNCRPRTPLANAVTSIFRFLMLYPLTLVGGALLLWLGMGLLSAGTPMTAPTNPASRTASSAAFGGVQLVAGGDDGKGKTSKDKPTYAEKREAGIKKGNEARDAQIQDRRDKEGKPSPTKLAAQQRADKARDDRQQDAFNKRQATRARNGQQPVQTPAGQAPSVGNGGGGQSTSGQQNGGQSGSGKSNGQQNGGQNGGNKSGQNGDGDRVSTKSQGGQAVVGQLQGGSLNSPAAVGQSAQPDGPTPTSSTAGCKESKGGKTVKCRVASGTGADRKVETCTRKNGKGCEDGLLVSTRGNYGEAGARVYFKKNGQYVARTRETTADGSATTATSTGRGNTGGLRSVVGAGSRCNVKGARDCHTKDKTVLAAGTPAATIVAAQANCGHVGAGSCTSRIGAAGNASCATGGPECRTRITATNEGTGDIATSSARCAQHKEGQCGAITRARDLSSTCKGTDGHTFCRTEAVAPAGATTGACTQTGGQCRTTSQLVNRKGAAEPSSSCTSRGSASICDTRAAALGGTPAVGYGVNLLGGSANSRASVRTGANCNASGAMIHCSSTSPRTGITKTSCDASLGARCREELDKKAGTETASCTAVSGREKCKTRSNGQSVAPLDPPAGEAVEPTMADLAAAANPNVFAAAGGRSSKPLTVEQAQAQVRRLQGRTARASEQLDRLAPQGAAVNAFADMLNKKPTMTLKQGKAFDGFNKNHSDKVDRQVNNYDKAHASLRKVDVALAQSSGDPAWAAKVTTASKRVDKSLALLNGMPEPKTDRQAKLFEKRSKDYQKALRDYNKAISTKDRAPGSGLVGYQLPSTGSEDVFAVQTAAGRLAGYQNYHGEFEDIFRGLTPDQLATQATYETVDQAVARLTREQAEANGEAVPAADTQGAPMPNLPMKPASAAPATGGAPAPAAGDETTPVADAKEDPATGPLADLLARARSQVDDALASAASDPETADQLAQAKSILDNPKGFVNGAIADALAQAGSDPETADQLAQAKSILADPKAAISDAVAEAAGQPEAADQLAQAKEALAGIKPSANQAFANALAQAKQALMDAFAAAKSEETVDA